MSARSILATALGLALSACASPNVQPVSSVVERHEALDGKKVRITGWIERCRGYNCAISELPGQKGAQIRIGASYSFDRAVGRYTGYEVLAVVEGFIDRTCFDHRRDPDANLGEILICTDRADQLRLPKLIRVMVKQKLPEIEEDE